MHAVMNLPVRAPARRAPAAGGRWESGRGWWRLWRAHGLLRAPASAAPAAHESHASSVPAGSIAYSWPWCKGRHKMWCADLCCMRHQHLAAPVLSGGSHEGGHECGVQTSIIGMIGTCAGFCRVVMRRPCHQQLQASVALLSQTGMAPHSCQNWPQPCSMRP